MPVFDITPNQNPQATGVMSFGVEGDDPAPFQVTSDGVMSLNGVAVGGGDAAGGPAYGMTPAYLPRWRAALANVRSGVGQAKLLCIGDSTTLGAGASVQGSYPLRLSAQLNTYYAPAVNGLSIPWSTNLSLVDTRWTVGSGWGFNGLYGWGKRSNYNAAPGASGNLVYNPGISVDTFDIYFMRSPSNGTTVATIAAGTTNINTNGALGVVKQTITVAAGMNTVSFAPPTGGSVYIIGVDAYLSTARQIRVGNAGSTGSGTGDWAFIDNAFDSSTCIKAYAPDLTICMLGINEATKTPPTSNEVWRSDILVIAAAARVSGEFIVASTVPTQAAAAAAAEGGYRDTAQALCNEQGWPMIDIFSRYGTWATANTAGFMNDDKHPNTRGYADLANGMYAALSTI